jgi:hypothetical protein
VIDYDKRIRDLEQALGVKRLNEKPNDQFRQHLLILDALQAKVIVHPQLAAFDELVNSRYKKFANEEDSLPDEVDIFEKVMRVREELERVLNFRVLSKKNKGAVAGAFSSGKSAFINSFFKDTKTVKLAEDVNAATAIPSYVVCGDDPKITGYNMRGAPFPIDPETYKTLTHDRMENRILDLRRIIRYITVSCPMDEGMLGNICLVDTPGFNPAEIGTAREDESTAASAIKDVDFLILLLLSESGTIDEATFRFITDNDFPFGKGGAEGRPLYIVVNNKADNNTESQLKDIIDFAVDTIMDKNLTCAGICAFNPHPRSGKDSLHIHRKMDLPDFLRKMNTMPSANIINIQQSLSEVFDRYEYYIENDFRRANVAHAALNKLKGDVYGGINDDVVTEDISAGFRVLQEQILPDKYRAHLDALDGIRREFNAYFKSLAREFGVDWAPPPRIKRKLFCNVCGTKLDGYFKHCPKCGESTIMEIKVE